MQALQLFQGLAAKRADTASNSKQVSKDHGGGGDAFARIFGDSHTAAGGARSAKPGGKGLEGGMRAINLKDRLASPEDKLAEALMTDVIPVYLTQPQGQQDTAITDTDETAAKEVISILEGITNTDINPYTERLNYRSMSGAEMSSMPADPVSAMPVQPAETMAETAPTDIAVPVTADGAAVAVPADAALLGDMQKLSQAEQLQFAAAMQAQATADKTVDQTDEVTARMPQQENSTKAVTATDEAELCPLENENDSGSVKVKAKTEGPDRDFELAENGGFGTKKAADEENAQARVIPLNQKVDVSPEKLASAEQMRMAPAEPVTTDNLFDRMVESIQTSSSQSTKTMELQLKPEHLGKVSIQLTLQDGEMHAKIRADDLGVKDMISGQLNRLIEQMENKGLKIADVEVVYTGVSDLTYGDKGQGRSDASGQQQYYGTRKQDSVSGYGDTMSQFADSEPVSVIDTGLSSVEYRA